MNLEEFNYYFRITDNLEKELWSKAIFVFDTSSILELYYYSEVARKEIFEKTLHLLKDKLWITSHTNFEYLKNRQPVIFKAFSEKYNKLKNEEIPNLKKDIFSILNKLNNVKQSTQKIDIHPFIDQNIFSSLDLTLESLQREFETFYTAFTNEVILRESEIKKLENQDEIYLALTKFFKITDDYGYDKIEKLFVNGKIRYESTIPPGFRDGTGKGEKEGIQKFGDLIIWDQMIELSNRLNLPIIFITNDVKDDWCNIEKRSNDTRISSPKDDLIIEFKHKTNKQFWMYSFSQFLYKAKEILNSQITIEALEEVKNISTDIFKNNKLCFNCIYQTKIFNNSYRQYLRFFEDGTVVGTSSVDDYNVVLIHLKYNYERRGTYILNDDKIIFKLTSSNGTIEYSGTFQDGFILMHVVSHINGHISEDKYFPIDV